MNFANIPTRTSSGNLNFLTCRKDEKVSLICLSRKDQCFVIISSVSLYSKAMSTAFANQEQCESNRKKVYRNRQYFLEVVIICIHSKWMREKGRQRYKLRHQWLQLINS